MSDRFEQTHQETGVCFRSNGDKEYIDIEINIDCPACPEDEDPETLEMVNDREDEECWAVCPGCGYEACVSVYEGVKKRR